MIIRSTPRRGPTFFGFRPTTWILGAALFAGAAGPVSAQATVTAMNLETCLATADARQPALAAARASLAAAESGKRGLDSLRFGALLSPDLPIRKEQSCLGITIAAAAVQQAEWETRYAVARTYWSVLYARSQLHVVDGVVEKLDSSAKKAKGFVAVGDPNIKVTQVDVDSLYLNLTFARAKRCEAAAGVEKATAALREAIGLCATDPLIVPDEPLPSLVESFDKAILVQWALCKRGEMAQAAAAAQVAELEICAQQRLFCRPVTNTFAAGADLHAKQIPQGRANGEFVPGAIGLEMPTTFAGHRPERTERAADFATRAQAVVEKTRNLITLEVDAAYLKWEEAACKARLLADAPATAAKTAKTVQGRFDQGATSGEDLIKARTQEDYAQAQYNEALFIHAVALATIERVTAGGYRMPTCPTAVLMSPQPISQGMPKQLP
jgi:outer membrane protein TolC